LFLRNDFVDTKIVISGGSSARPLYDLIQECSPGPYLELFARGSVPGWDVWGNQAEEYMPDWPTYSNHSQVTKMSRDKETGRMVSIMPKKIDTYVGGLQRKLQNPSEFPVSSL
jgi:hypothetical protein